MRVRRGGRVIRDENRIRMSPLRVSGGFTGTDARRQVHTSIENDIDIRRRLSEIRIAMSYKKKTVFHIQAFRRITLDLIPYSHTSRYARIVDHDTDMILPGCWLK